MLDGTCRRSVQAVEDRQADQRRHADDRVSKAPVEQIAGAVKGARAECERDREGQPEQQGEDRDLRVDQVGERIDQLQLFDAKAFVAALLR